jgi:hypothetical protein
MKSLILLILISVGTQVLSAAEPQLLVPAGKSGWTNPVIAPDGKTIAFANASLSQIRALISGEDSSRAVMSNPGVGRRFVFEPGGQDRILYRRRVQALPDHPERLISVSIYLADPMPRTSNLKGDMFGPYLIGNRVWYRDSLTGPLKDLRGVIQKAGPYLDDSTGQLNVLNKSGKTVFASSPPQRFALTEISPDGQWVAAVQIGPDHSLFLIPVASGDVIRVNNAMDPGWSGNSRSILCVRRLPSQAPELYRVHLPKGDGETLLSSSNFDPETPVLNMDGTKAVFVSKGSIYSLDTTP